VILVIGRPALDERGALQGNAALVAVAAARAGAQVEVVGSVGDDHEGDAVAVELARAGIGHAALLRDPAGATPRGSGPAAGPPPRLDGSDVELGLLYLADCRVLVVAEWLGEDVLAVAKAAAAYHSAELIVLLEPQTPEPKGLPARATLLRAPAEGGAAFADVVGRYAAALAAGQPPAPAWAAALAGTGWSETGEA